MKKRTRSILDELRNIGRVQDTEVPFKTTGSNIIEKSQYHANNQGKLSH